jgi:hypothetical protein
MVVTVLHFLGAHGASKMKVFMRVGEKKVLSKVGDNHLKSISLTVRGPQDLNY